MSSSDHLISSMLLENFKIDHKRRVNGRQYWIHCLIYIIIYIIYNIYLVLAQ